MRRVNESNADASAKASQRRVVVRQSSVDASYGPKLKMIGLSQLQDLDLCVRSGTRETKEKGAFLMVINSAVAQCIVWV